MSSRRQAVVAGGKEQHLIVRHRSAFAMPVVIVSLAVVVASCGGGKDGPTAPTGSQSTVSVQSIQSTPAGTGVQFNTNFQFDASGAFPPGTQFAWQFGDGTSATTNTPTTSKVYSQTGSFTVSVEARAGANSSASTRQVSVRSLIGRWVGTITGHTTYPRNRPIPIPGFELVVTGVGPPVAGARTAPLAGSWADNAGCRESRPGFINQVFSYSADAAVEFGIESLTCNDGDFFLAGTADATFNQVQGSCAKFGGPDCRFQMTRQ